MSEAGIIVTPALLEAVAGKPVANDIDRPLAAALTRWTPQYGVNSAPRMAHALAQFSHETGGFARFVERGNGDKDGDGLDDYLTRYDFRKDLGNGAKGDGERYRGRGLIQITGRDNYARYGKRLGLDLLGNPGLALDFDVSVRVACLYWNDRGLNSLADQDDVLRITRAINGGTNGLSDRIECLNRAKMALGVKLK